MAEVQKIIICGAGRVGEEMARQLSLEGNDVTIIDIDEELIKTISDTMDVRGVSGSASYPDVLERAGASSADMIIAVTNSDEVNFTVCRCASRLFDVERKIARIKAKEFLEPNWSDFFGDDLQRDHIIFPEQEVANTILEKISLAGANDSVSFADGLVKVLGFVCHRDSYLKNKSLPKLEEYFSLIKLKIVAIIRDDELLLPASDLIYRENDMIYVTVAEEDVAKAFAMFGIEDKEAKNFLIVGGGNIGFYIAEKFENDEKYFVKLIELGQKRALYIADKLNNTIVINGSVLDQNILNEINMEEIDTFIAVTNDDKVNILSSLLAKRNKCPQVVCLINNLDVYGSMVTSLGIDIIVSPGEVTVSSMLSKIKHNYGMINAVHTICAGKSEIIEIVIRDDSIIVGKSIKEIDDIEEVFTLAMVRKGEVIMPDYNLFIEEDDILVVLAKSTMVNSLENVIRARFEYF